MSICLSSCVSPMGDKGANAKTQSSVYMDKVGRTDCGLHSWLVQRSGEHCDWNPQWWQLAIWPVKA
jgi:hypothetical protein